MDLVFGNDLNSGDPIEIICKILNISKIEEASNAIQDGKLIIDYLIRQLVLSRHKMMSGKKTQNYITNFHKVISLIDNASNIVVLLGAGGSVGPDFRSPGGLYDQIAKSNVFEDPTCIFDLDVFHQHSSVFWQFAHLFFPSETPEHSCVHYFIERLEKNGKLLKLYSQNVDTLECGIPEEKLRCVHGSWRNNKCLGCGENHSVDDLRPYVLEKTEPRCKNCGGIIKPGVVFFGEKTFFDEMEAYYDSMKADLFIAIGTSLLVSPISSLPIFMSNVPSVFINRAPMHVEFNAKLLGDCNNIVKIIENELNWNETESIHKKECSFMEPNLFVFESNNILDTKIVSNPRNDFLVFSVPMNVDDLQ